MRGAVFEDIAGCKVHMRLGNQPYKKPSKPWPRPLHAWTTLPHGWVSWVRHGKCNGCTDCMHIQSWWPAWTACTSISPYSLPDQLTSTAVFTAHVANIYLNRLHHLDRLDHRQYQVAINAA